MVSLFVVAVLLVVVCVVGIACVRVRGGGIACGSRCVVVVCCVLRGACIVRGGVCALPVCVCCGECVV